MIEVKVEEFCEGCQDFDPAPFNRVVLYADDTEAVVFPQVILC